MSTRARVNTRERNGFADGFERLLATPEHSQAGAQVVQDTHQYRSEARRSGCSEGSDQDAGVFRRLKRLDRPPPGQEHGSEPVECGGGRALNDVNAVLRPWAAS